MTNEPKTTDLEIIKLDGSNCTGSYHVETSDPGEAALEALAAIVVSVSTFAKANGKTVRDIDGLLMALASNSMIITQVVGKTREELQARVLAATSRIYEAAMLAAQTTGKPS